MMAIEMVSQRAHDKLSAQVALLQSAVEALRLTNDGHHGAQPSSIWVALKAALPPGVCYETARSWCERGFVTAQKQGGRWFVDPESLSAVSTLRLSSGA